MKANSSRRGLLLLLVLSGFPLGCSKGDGAVARLQGHQHGILSLSFSSDGRFLASGDSHDEIRVWSLSEQKAIRELHSGQAELPLEIAAVSLSSNGELLAAGFKGVRTWKVQTGESVPNSFDLRKAVRSLSYSGDDSFLAAAGEDQEIGLWKMRDGGKESRLKGHESAVLCLAVNKGDGLASGGQDQTIRIWDVQTGKLKSTIAAGTAVRALAWSSDGASVVSWGDDHRIRRWTADGGQETGGFRAAFDRGAFSPDGLRFGGISPGGKLTILDTGSGTAIREFETKGAAACLCLSTDGAVAVGRLDGTVVIYSVR